MRDVTGKEMHMKMDQCMAKGVVPVQCEEDKAGGCVCTHM